MQLYSATLDTTDLLVVQPHRCMDDLRAHLALHRGRPVLVDSGSDDLPATSAAALQRLLQGLSASPSHSGRTPILVTERLHALLVPSERARASFITDQGRGVRMPDGAALLLIDDGLERPWVMSQGLVTRDVNQPTLEKTTDRQVAIHLLNAPVDGGKDPLPIRLQGKIRSGQLQGLRHLLKCTDDDLRRMRNIGRSTMVAFDKWVRRRTLALGRELSHNDVRGLLTEELAAGGPQAPEDRKADSAVPLDALAWNLLATPWEDAEPPLPEPFITLVRLGTLSTQSLLLKERADLEQICRLIDSDSDLVASLEEWVRARTRHFGRDADLETLRPVMRMVAGGDHQEASFVIGTVRSLLEGFPPSVLDSPPSELPGLTVRASGALARAGVEKLSDLRRWTDEEMLAWRNFGSTSLNDLKQSLQALRAEVVRGAGGADVPIVVVARNRLMAQPLREYVALRLERLGPRARTIVRLRTLASGPRATLEEVGRELGVTRERIRQIEQRLSGKLDGNGWLRRFLDERIGGLRRGRSSPLRLDQLETLDQWFNQIAEVPRWFAGLLELLKCAHRVVPAEPTCASFVTAATAGDPSDLARELRVLVARNPGRPVEELGRELLAGRDAIEVLPEVLVRLGRVIEGPAGPVVEPTMVQQVEAVLHHAEGPLAIAEIAERLRQAGVPIREHSVRGAMERADVVNVGPSTYLLASKLAPWNSYQDAVARDVEQLMQGDLSRQWKVHDLVSVLTDAGVIWAASMPSHVVEHLLSGHPAFRQLGRGMWCLKQAPRQERITVKEAAVAALEHHGAPMSYMDLDRAVRATRRIGANMSIRWPLVRLADAMIGLGPRDLGIPDEVFHVLRARCDELLLEGAGRLSADELIRLATEAWPQNPPPASRVLARMLAVPPLWALDGTGDGLRRSDVPRLSQSETGDPVDEPRSPESPGTPALHSTCGDGSAVPLATRSGIDDVLHRIEDGRRLDDIASELHRLTGRPWPRGTIRMHLRNTGWEESSDGLWHRGLGEE